MEIKERVESRAQELEERVRPQIDAAREKLGELNERVVTFIKAHPAQALLGALALGYLVGRIARGSSRHGSE